MTIYGRRHYDLLHNAPRAVKEKRMSTILNDKRPIKSAWGQGEDPSGGATVGFSGVTRIESYAENGQMACVPWLKVWKGDILAARLNAALVVEIVYDDEAPAA